MSKDVLKFSCGHVLEEGDKVKVLVDMEPIFGGAAIVQQGKKVLFVKVRPGGSPVEVETLDPKRSAEIIRGWENITYDR